MTSQKASAKTTTSKPTRRTYNSPLRERQAAETRKSIIDAGVEIIHELPNWDWKSLTFKAVGERAGISERTVYRHFSTERKLKDAIMRQLVDTAGVDLSSMELKDFPEVTAVVYQFLSKVASVEEEETDPTFASIDEHRRQALLSAVIKATPSWSTTEQENTAALLDILWNLPPLERLTKLWRFDTQRSTEIVGWLIRLIEEAIKDDRRPG